MESLIICGSVVIVVVSLAGIRIRSITREHENTHSWPQLEAGARCMVCQQNEATWYIHIRAIERALRRREPFLYPVVSFKNNHNIESQALIVCDKCKKIGDITLTQKRKE